MGFTLKLNTKNIKTLKAVINNLSHIIENFYIRITSKEFIIMAMDDSRICLLRLELKREFFDEYECSKESRIGLSMSDLNKIMKRGTTDESFEISFKEIDNKIKIRMQRKEEKARTRTFSLKLQDDVLEDVPMHKLLAITYSAEWTMNINYIIEAIKDAEIYSEVFEIRASNDNGIIFSSLGTIGEMEYDLDIDDLDQHKINETNKGDFSIDFLKVIMGMSHITEKLEMSLKEGFPLKLNFDLLGGGKLDFFLAPRVDVEDDDDDDFDDF